MKTEISAGGIVVCCLRQVWFILILKDKNGVWTFPKGIIEKDEKPEDAAAREIREEVGIDSLTRLTPLAPIQYYYRRNGIIKKTVNYFIYTTKTRIEPKPQIEEGISDAIWVPYKQAKEMIGYRDTNVPLLEETWKLLQRRTSKN